MTLLYIVRNNFEDECYGHSILGVFTSLEEAYKAGRKKYQEINNPKHHMELKITIPNLSNYFGCSAYNLNFAREYSAQELQELDQKIREWDTWHYFETYEQRKAEGLLDFI